MTKENGTIYVVACNGCEAVALVRAKSRAQAAAHVVDAHPASQDELVRHLGDGTKIEDLMAKPEPAAG